MHIYVLMGGLGKRFTDVGEATLKPFITFEGKPMIEHVLNGVPTSSYKTGLILREQTLQDYQEKIKSLRKYYDLEVLSINTATRGPVCTILEAKEHLPISGSILFLDCDGLYRNRIIEKFIQKALEANCDAAVITVESNLSHFSYVAVDNYGFVKDIREKVPISQNAITGAYFFKDVQEFLSVAGDQFTEILKYNSEYFLSDVIGGFVSLGSKVETFMVDSSDYSSVGTPEQLEYYLARK
jgi:dTDP-glucose pyrophosphorylase